MVIIDEKTFQYHMELLCNLVIQKTESGWLLVCVSTLFSRTRLVGSLSSLGDGGDVVAGAAHLGQHLVQPLEGAVQVDLNPAGGGGDVLPVVPRAPALYE